MADSQPLDSTSLVVDAVDDPVVTAVRAEGALELEAERTPDPGRVAGQGP